MLLGYLSGAPDGKYSTEGQEGIPEWGERKEGVKLGRGDSGLEWWWMAEAAAKFYPPFWAAEPDIHLLSAN